MGLSFAPLTPYRSVSLFLLPHTTPSLQSASSGVFDKRITPSALNMTLALSEVAEYLCRFAGKARLSSMTVVCVPFDLSWILLSSTLPSSAIVGQPRNTINATNVLPPSGSSS